jgi:hypothetical protein
MVWNSSIVSLLLSLDGYIQETQLATILRCIPTQTQVLCSVFSAKISVKITQIIKENNI